MEKEGLQKRFFVQDFTHLPPQKWEGLLQYVLNKANFVELVIGGEDLPPSLKPFRSSLVKLFSSRWRWGSRQLGSTTYARLALSDGLKRYILERPTLGHWLRDLEDPTFYIDEQVIMWTISHENLAFVWLSTDEAINFNAQGYSLEATELML
ncbi:MAG: hypothetical protein ACK4VW_00330 [Anaerolineales bacterium]